MRNILVTGASGFVGSHLVARLAGEAVSVKCLIRRRAASRFEDGPVSAVVGDLCDPERLAEAVVEADVVFHLAGQTLALNARQFEAVNVGGTHNLAKACAAQSRPPAVVFLSSVAAAGPCAARTAMRETDRPRPASAYGDSKLSAERCLATFAERVPITVIRAPSVFGPGERYMLDMFRCVRRGWHFCPGRRDFRLSLLHVADLVEGLLAAARRGERLPAAAAETGCSGQGIYFLAAEECPSYAELGRLVAAAMDCPRPRVVRLPAAACRAVACVGEAVGRVRGRPMLLCRDKIRESLAGDWVCSAEKARAQLGFTPGASLLARLRQTADWYQQRGWL